MKPSFERRIPDGVRAVFFDAVGTLIHPEPPAGLVYAQVGRRHGSRLTETEVRRRFTAAFLEEEKLDTCRQHRTDERREYARWQAIVAAVLDDVESLPECFQALYEHFARPAAWRCEPGAGRVLRQLHLAGYRVGVASNFDHRLRGVIQGLTELPPLDHLLISSEVGWKKPAGPFFARLCQVVGLPPAAILYIGDSLDNDHAGAVGAGMHAWLFDPENRSALPPAKRLGALGELLHSVGG